MDVASRWGRMKQATLLSVTTTKRREIPKRYVPLTHSWRKEGKTRKVPGVETRGADSIIACLCFSIPSRLSFPFIPSWVTSATFGFPPAERGLASGLGCGGTYLFWALPPSRIRTVSNESDRVHPDQGQGMRVPSLNEGQGMEQGPRMMTPYSNDGPWPETPPVGTALPFARR